MDAPADDVLGGEPLLASWPGRYRKLDGRLLLTASRLVHRAVQPDTAGESHIIDLREASSYLFSKRQPGKDVALLQVTTHEGRKHTVELTCPDSRWAHQAELAEWIKDRERVAKRLEDERKEEAERLGARMRVVLECPQLRERYNYLVKQTQAMSHAQFCSAHAQEIAVKAPLARAPSVDLAPLQLAGDSPDRTGAASSKGGDRAVMSEEGAKAIFKELPPLEQLYQSVVPTLVSKSQFWARCLASRYYLESMGREVPRGHPADPLFDSLAPAAAAVAARAGQPPTAPPVLVDAAVDLTGEPPRDGAPQLPQRKARLLERLNERSAGVVAAMAAAAAARDSAASQSSGSRSSGDAATAPSAAGAGDADLAAVVERRRGSLRLAAAGLQEDLTSPGPPAKVPRLQVRRNGPGLPCAAEPAVASAMSAGARRALSHWAAQGQPGSPLATPTEKGTKWALVKATNDMIEADRLAMAQRSKGAQQELPRDIREVLVRAGALLEHFWASRESEADMRSRLMAEMDALLPTLERWQAGSDATARRSARSFVPPIRRAKQFLQQCKAAAA